MHTSPNGFPHSLCPRPAFKSDISNKCNRCYLLRPRMSELKYAVLIFWSEWKYAMPWKLTWASTMSVNCSRVSPAFSSLSSLSTPLLFMPCIFKRDIRRGPAGDKKGFLRVDLGFILGVCPHFSSRHQKIRKGKLLSTRVRCTSQPYNQCLTLAFCENS